MELNEAAGVDAGSEGKGAGRMTPETKWLICGIVVIIIVFGFIPIPHSHNYAMPDFATYPPHCPDYCDLSSFKTTDRCLTAVCNETYSGIYWYVWKVVK